jgi:tryptophan-rich hypothetical protein
MSHNLPNKIAKRIVNPNKLMRTKWTAINPINKEKHFMVIKVVIPDVINLPIELIELEAVFSGCKQMLAWKQLNDTAIWLQGWV